MKDAILKINTIKNQKVQATEEKESGTISVNKRKKAYKKKYKEENIYEIVCAKESAYNRKCTKSVCAKTEPP